MTAAATEEDVDDEDVGDPEDMMKPMSSLESARPVSQWKDITKKTPRQTLLKTHSPITYQRTGD